MPTDTLVETKKHLELQLAERRAAAADLRTKTEASIMGALALANETVRRWQTMWEAAVAGSVRDRAKEAETLRRALEEADQQLREVLQWTRQHANMFEGPLARLSELEARTAEFPLWARECLARWQMLDWPAPILDPERIARVHAAYANGELEDLRDVQSRVEAGGPWVKE